MKASDIKTIEDMQTYIEGCINDFESGASTKNETFNSVGDLVFRVFELCNASGIPLIRFLDK